MNCSLWPSRATIIDPKTVPLCGWVETLVSIGTDRTVGRGVAVKAGCGGAGNGRTRFVAHGSSAGERAPHFSGRRPEAQRRRSSVFHLQPQLPAECLKRLESVLADKIQLHGARVRRGCGRLDLWIDYTWDEPRGTGELSPLARRFRRGGRARASVAPWRADGDRRTLLIALAHIVAEIAGSTGLGLRLLSGENGRLETAVFAGGRDRLFADRDDAVQFGGQIVDG